MDGIIFIAPPAAGKGTQSKLICNKYNIPHISAGDLLREIASRDEEKRKYIEKHTQSGKLVSDKFMIDIVYAKLKEPICDKGYILDGFPRDINQAIGLDDILKKLNKKLGYVFLLDISYDLSRTRIVGRQSCPNCGKVYNFLDPSSKSKLKDICDDCKATLIKRDDDNDETFKKRYDTYLKETAPILSYYERKGMLHRIDASLSIEEVFNQITNIIG